MEDSTLEALGESLASNNEWVSSGTILVQVHETIDPISEATEVDLASKIRISSVFPKSLPGFHFEPPVG